MGFHCWRKIESAPEGEEFLACDEEGGTYGICRVDITERGRRIIDQACEEVLVTHWQVLPKMPGWRRTKR